MTDPVATFRPADTGDITRRKLNALAQAVGGSGAGTVTSIDGSGGGTGLTVSGGPVTTTGTLTLGGTLGVAHGGTGAASLTGYVKGAGPSALTASATIPAADISGLALSALADVTITAANLNALDDGTDTTLHYHAADRSRANHTGTQAGSTITGAYTAAGLTMATARLLGRATAGSGATEEIPVGTGLSLSGGTLVCTVGGVSDGDKGDITVASAGTSWTIDSDAVSNAKLANMAQATIKGRASGAGTGDPTDLTATQARAILNVADGATANAPDATLLARANHTGTQAGSTVTGAYTAAGLTMATARLLGRATASAGAAEEIGVGAGLSLSAGSLACTLTGLTDGDKGDIMVASSGASWTIDGGAVSYAKIQAVSATDRLLGRATAGAGVIEEITCTAAGRALLDDASAAAQRTTLGAAGSGAIGASGLTMATARILGRTTAATGAVEELTGTSATAMLDAFTSSLKGLVPASGGGTTKFLRADGTFVDPIAGLGSGWTTIATLPTTSGSSVIFTAIPTTYKFLLAVFLGVSQTIDTMLTMALSSDGVTYTSNTSLLFVSSMQTGALYGGVLLPGYRATTGIGIAIGAQLASNNMIGVQASGVGDTGFSGFAWRVAGIQALRFGPAAGNFDAGSILLLGAS